MKTVSPFELAITQIADPEAAKEMRAETPEEKRIRFTKKFDEFMGKIRTNPPGGKAKIK